MNDNVSDMPLVSIVLPTYKRAHLLSQAIRSVLDQTYANLELIIVDDNSPDDTAAVVQSFDDARIRYVKNDPNLKLPRALNQGFCLARGEYLTWTSDDNLYAPNAIEKMVDALRDKGCHFVYADYYLFAEQDTDGRPLDVYHDKLPGSVQLEKGNHIGACFMYTREVYEAVGEYDPELFLVEDYDYFMRIAKRFRMCHIPEPLYYFRRDDATLFCSRFCEVKASDFLVRYKNEMLSDREVLDAVVALIARNKERLKMPLLRWTYLAVNRLSYRLTRMHETMTVRYMRHKLRNPVFGLLENYRTKKMTFDEAKSALMGLMKRLGTIEYVQPKLN
ncbi:glycosyltransferase family 2 protein [Methylocaldum sp.]|uniref:glycosyltransferase family 2 protein n=1 Tax=Methylocaldum sp. TaxID=1969727 RepID=UPI002D2CBDD7|nr:glycosyltransferase [Methylocaldum sp.]HYE37885.1 glycosyltransferase [Methylocaldum sp.]